MSIDKAKQYLMNTYASFPLVIDHGEGVYVYDDQGNKYLDFVAGIAVNTLGYQDEDYNNALIEQIKKFTHCSNLYYNEPAIDTAELLVNHSGLDKVFYSNSGAEANEGAIKLARKYGKTNKGENCYQIIAMNQSFHGRTLGALAATGQTKYQDDFKPMINGFDYSPFNDIESLEKKINENVCAIFVEPIQGEGGIHPANKDFLVKVRELCDKHNIVLIFDEVQCGIGRSGEMFCYQTYGIVPDIVTLAKGLGGGVPIGAIVAKDKVASVFVPGNHATTYGGNPLVTAAAKVVLSKVGEKTFLENVKEMSEYLTEQLKGLQDNFDCVIDNRGLGLMQCIEFNIQAKDIIVKCMENGLLLVGSGANVIRFVPPLVVNKLHIDEMIKILKSAIEEVTSEN